jgi:hypothetical protein
MFACGHYNFDPQRHGDSMGSNNLWSFWGYWYDSSRRMSFSQGDGALAAHRDQHSEHDATWCEQLLHAMLVFTNAA